MRLKIIALAVPCFVVQSACAVTSIADMKALREKEFAFEYCGIDSRHCDFSVSESDRQLQRLIDLKGDCFDLSTNLLVKCSLIEASCFTKRSGTERYMLELATLLEKFACESRTNAVVRNAYWRWICQVEYMVARMAEKENECCIDSDAIAKLLSDGLFVSDNKVERRFLDRCKRFRDLLIVANDINRFKIKYGRLPDRFELEECVYAGAKYLNEEVRYSCKDDDWQLIGCSKSAKIQRDFNVYVPFLDARRYVWPQSDIVFLSSDFSRKRRRLFDGEILNEGTYWACKLEKCQLVRPD